MKSKSMKKKLTQAAIAAGATLAVTTGGSVFADEAVVSDTSVPTADVSSTGTETTTTDTGNATVDNTAPSVDTPSTGTDVPEVPTTPSEGGATTDPTVPSEVPGGSETTPSTDNNGSSTETTPSTDEKPSGSAETATQAGIAQAQQNQQANQTPQPTTPTKTAQEALEQGESQVGTVSQVTGQTVENVTPEAPVVTDTGYTIVSTKNSQVVVKNADGQLATVAAASIGATVNADGTISVKDESGKERTLPETPVKESLLLTLFGGLLAYLGIRLITKKENIVLTKISY